MKQVNSMFIEEKTQCSWRKIVKAIGTLSLSQKFNYYIDCTLHNTQCEIKKLTLKNGNTIYDETNEK